jgi:hypothetical protein
MSKGANKDFQSDPEAFLRNNVIIVREGLMPDSGNYLMNLKESEMEEVIDANNVKLRAFVPFLAETAGTPNQLISGETSSRFSHTFRAFWLPWQPNQHKVLNLGNEADYFFTPGLTGCTFAANGGANPQVGHFNYTRIENNAQMVDEDATYRAVKEVLGDFPDAYIDKTMSMSGIGLGGPPRYVYIVGWRMGGGWRFVAQKLDFIGATKTGRRFQRMARPQPIHNGSNI